MGVAQLVERWIVVPVAEGSNPSTHPKIKKLELQTHPPKILDCNGSLWVESRTSVVH